jgi:hypothetical protein
MAADPTQEEEDRSPSFQEADEVIEDGGYYLCSGVGHDGKEQCRFIALCTGVQDASADGVFWHGEFISSSCPYWQYWMNNPGEDGCVAAHHVFHACAVAECDAEYPGGDEEVVHIPWWCRIDESKAMSIIVDWHAADAEIEWPEAFLGEIPATLVARWANRAPRPPAGAGRGRAAAAVPPGGAPASSAPRRLGVSAKAAPAPSSAAGLKRGRPDEGASQTPAGVGAALSRAAAGAASAAPSGAVGGTLTPPGGEAQEADSGLPAVGVWGGGASAGAGAFGLSASAAKRPRSVSGGNDSKLADVLAARAQERSAAAPSAAADGEASGAEAVMRLLARALQPGAGASDPDGLGLSAPLGSSAEGGVPAGLASKRAHYRRVAAEHPGRLFRTGLTTMAEQLSPLDGGEYSSEVPPIVLKYLLTTFLPQNPVKAIGSDMYRQLRTLAEVMDALIEGRVPAALDLLMQRFKACQLSLQDRSWAAARWLELIPATEGQTAVSPADEELAQQITLAELRLSKLRQDLQG